MIVDIFLSFLAFFLYLQLGLYVLFTKSGSKVNRSFFYLCLSLVIWSFGFMFIHASTDKQIVVFWETVASFGWIFFPALLVNFFFDLNRAQSLLFKSITKLAFFLAGILFFIQSILGNLLTNEYVYIDEQWVFKPDIESIWYLSFMIYLVLSIGISFYLLINWSFKTQVRKEKKQSQIIMATLTLYFAGIFLNSYLLPIIQPVDFPSLIHVTSFLWVIGFSYAIVRYKFLVITPQIAANEIIANMKELLFFLDSEGKIIRINQFTQDILGFDWPEIINKPFESILIDKDLAQQLLSGQNDLEDVKQHDYYLRKKNGEIIPFNLSSAEVKDDAGDILGTIIVGYDVRYEKMLEEALRSSEKKYRELYTMVRLMCDNVPDLIWAKDLDRKYIFANKATCEKLLNTENPEEPIGQSDEFFYQRERDSRSDNKQWFTFADDIVDSDRMTIEKREPGRYLESGFVHGQFTFFDVHKAPFWDENGEMIGIVGCGRDVTQEKRVEEERLKAELALHKEKELLSVTLKSIGDGVISTDISGRIILMNSVAEDLTGWKKEEALGRQFSQVYRIVNPKTEEECNDPVRLVLDSGKIVTYDHYSILVTRTGKRLFVSNSGAPIYNQNGIIIGVVVAFSDVTQKQRIEQELIKIQKLETVGALAGGIAHDFNNILTAIMGNISMVIRKLRRERGFESLTGRLYTAEKACFRAKDLSRQLLTFSRGGDPIKKIIKLEKTIEDTVLFAAKGSKVNCHLNISDDLKAVEVDENQICQVINNLVINALQAMPDGGDLTVNADNIEIGEKSDLPLRAGEYIRMEIADTGEGIAAEQLEQIFDPFYTTKQEGSGLGLSISFNIMTRHDGYLLAASKPGEGSLFTMFIPVARGEYVPESKEKIELSFKGEGKVILMDDDLEIRMTLGNMLESLGFQVIATQNGEETLDIFQKAKAIGEEISFLILDLIIIQGMGGKETITKLKEIDPDIKAIVSSGYSNDPVIAEYADYGFDSAIEKPYTISNLIRAINSMLKS